MTSTATSKRPGRRKTRRPAEPSAQARDRARRIADYERRLRIAVFHPHDPVPDDADEFRLAVVRKISMFINAWHGCRLRRCRRNRGCMAPDNRCADRVETPSTPEETKAAMIQAARAVRAEIARREAQQADEAAQR